MKLKGRNCEFLRNEVKFLERIISKDGYRSDPEQVSALVKMKENPPKTVGELKQILGFLGYYCRYVKNFSREAKILYDLLCIPEDMKSRNRSKGHPSSRTKIVWESKHQYVLESLTNMLMSPPVMAISDFDQPFILHTDASGT